MFADIFIHRPRLAMVIAIIITLAGTTSRSRNTLISRRRRCR
jgi:multidrug efflux pump subunit AcrB